MVNGLVKMSTSADVVSVTWRGTVYKPDKKGFVYVPHEAVRDFEAHGFEVVDVLKA